MRSSFLPYSYILIRLIHGFSEASNEPDEKQSGSLTKGGPEDLPHPHQYGLDPLLPLGWQDRKIKDKRPRIQARTTN